jgi:hypothetical protein
VKNDKMIIHIKLRGSCNGLYQGIWSEGLMKIEGHLVL